MRAVLAEVRVGVDEEATMAHASEKRCPTPGCSGSLGAWNAGEFYPAPHLRPTRDMWVNAAGHLLVRCSRCNTWWTIARDDATGRLVLRPAA